MILEIISRIFIGLVILLWIISFVCFRYKTNKRKVWEIIFSSTTTGIFVGGFITSLCYIFGL